MITSLLLVTVAVTPPLRYVDPDGEDYRTPRSGEGFRTRVFGEEIAVEPRSRRLIGAWDLGMAATIKGVLSPPVVPFGSLFFWYHPDDQLFFRGIVVGVFNELLLRIAPKDVSPFELVLGFDNLTVPLFPQSEIIDGEQQKDEELVWGHARAGVGVGFKAHVPPGHNDNLITVALLAEPGFLYFGRGSESAPELVEPPDTFEIRGRFRLRYDGIQRNLLELPHSGFGAGCDLVGGRRTRWRPWGLHAREPARAAWYTAEAYALAASGLPFLGERHRLVTTLHVGHGIDLDRFNRFRLGGGPHGEEFLSTARVVLPGAALQELLVDRYAVLVTEYRFEPIFFAYLSVRASGAYARRKRLTEGGIVVRDDLLASIGGRATSGFVFETRIQIDYNSNFAVVRDGRLGGHEISVHVSGDFF